MCGPNWLMSTDLFFREKPFPHCPQWTGAYTRNKNPCKNSNNGVARSEVCVLGRQVNCAKTDEVIEKTLGDQIRLEPRNPVLRRVQIPRRRRGNFLRGFASDQIWLCAKIRCNYKCGSTEGGDRGPLRNYLGHLSKILRLCHCFWKDSNSTAKPVIQSSLKIPIPLTCYSSSQAAYHDVTDRTIPMIAEGAPFSGSKNTALCDF